MNIERIRMNPSWFLRTEQIRQILDARHCNHTRAAQLLRLSRAHWSQLFNRRRPITAGVRYTLLSCPLFKDIPEDQLWERVESP